MAGLGIVLLLHSALLFGAGTPLARLLLGTVVPWMPAGRLDCRRRAGSPGRFC
ncbi:hypothetical protein [Geminicoccus roseus]|uniref:hypothetical protein n=1 Tax=Geminicoccus roseus TaxID=404900 RepID=UPI00040264A0